MIYLKNFSDTLNFYLCDKFFFRIRSNKNYNKEKMAVDDIVFKLIIYNYLYKRDGANAVSL